MKAKFLAVQSGYHGDVDYACIPQTSKTISHIECGVVNDGTGKPLQAGEVAYCGSAEAHFFPSDVIAIGVNEKLNEQEIKALFEEFSIFY